LIKSKNKIKVSLNTNIYKVLIYNNNLITDEVIIINKYIGKSQQKLNFNFYIQLKFFLIFFSDKIR